MRAVRLHDAGDLRVDEIAPPGPPPPGQVNIAVRAAGICGSDLHNFRTGQWITRKPSVAGHEFCGVVTEIGDGVALAPGDTVVADSRVWCGECVNCRAGLPHVCERLGFVGEACDGGFAEATQLPARLLHRHPASLAPEIACLAEPLAVALHAVRRLAPSQGEPVLVVGCGAIGGLCALLLAAMHDGRILLADRNAARSAALAAAVGGTAVELSAADVAGALGRPLRHAVDASGSVAALAATLGLLAAASSIALVGIAHEKLALDPNLLVEREITLYGCHAFRDELPDAISLLPALEPRLRPLLGATVALEEVPAAYARLLAGTAPGLKTLIDPARRA